MNNSLRRAWYPVQFQAPPGVWERCPRSPGGRLHVLTDRRVEPLQLLTRTRNQQRLSVQMRADAAPLHQLRFCVRACLSAAHSPPLMHWAPLCHCDLSVEITLSAHGWNSDGQGVAAPPRAFPGVRRFSSSVRVISYGPWPAHIKDVPAV